MKRVPWHVKNIINCDSTFIHKKLRRFYDCVCHEAANDKRKHLMSIVSGQARARSQPQSLKRTLANIFLIITMMKMAIFYNSFHVTKHVLMMTNN